MDTREVRARPMLVRKRRSPWKRKSNEEETF